MQDLVTIVAQIADLTKTGPDPLGLYFSEREARSHINKTFTSARTRRDAQAFFTELTKYRIEPVAKMPQYAAKRKRPLGLLATRNAKRAKTGRDKYGAKSIDWNAASKLADQAAASAVRRATETTYSQSGAYLNTNATTLTKSGYSMSGLNQSAGYIPATSTTRLNATSNCFVWPVSPMAQVGNTSTPGYRKGQRINPIGFRFSISHYQGLASTQGATYHWAFIRNKGVSLQGTQVTTPVISSTDSVALFVPFIQGPLVTNGPNGTIPNGDFSSAARWNYPEWQKVKSGTWTMPAMLARENSAVINAPTANANNQNASKLIQGYVPIKDAHWEYPTPTAISNIKGGDYFFVIWREGFQDPYINSDAMVMMYELSFKDP